MGFDYNKYMKKYNQDNIIYVSLKLHKINDQDIIEVIDLDNKQGSIKELIREALRKR